MLSDSLLAEEGSDADPSSPSDLFDVVDWTNDRNEDDGDIPADDVRRHFMQSGLFSSTRPELSSEETDADFLLMQAPIFWGGKQRKTVTMTCATCGASGKTIKNHGGATRETVNNSAKYKMECQETLGGCGRRCLLARDPNPDGTYTQSESKFTIPGEAKLRPSYKCGECGMIKSRGHTAVCIGKRKRTDNDISSTGAVLKRAKTLLGDAYGPDMAAGDDDDDAYDTLSPLPLLPPVPPLPCAPFGILGSVLHSKQVVTAVLVTKPVGFGEWNQHNEEALEEAADKSTFLPMSNCGEFGILNSRGHAATVCTGKPKYIAEAMSTTNVVLKRAKETLLGGTYGPDVDDDDVDASLPTLQPLPCAPFASFASGVASKQPGTTLLVAPVVTTTTVAAPSLTTEPVEFDERNQDNEEEEALDKSKATLLPISNAKMMSLAVHVRNGNEAVALLKLKRYKVKGDGSCWVYAILACAGLCESRSLTTEKWPTSRDRGMDRVCRQLAYLWLHDHRDVLMRDEVEALDEILDKLPQHPMVDEEDFGSFGTINTIMGLAAYLDVSIVCWNKTTMRDSNALQQVVVHLHDETAPNDDVREQNMTPSEIVTFSQMDSRVMHLEWNGVNHFSAFVGPTDVPIKQAVRNGLIVATPVADVNPKSLKHRVKKMSNVSGWLHLVDLYRTDLTLKVVSVANKKKSLKQLLEHARTNNHHGVIYYLNAQQADVVCYVKFAHNGKLTLADFLKCGDFSCSLYIDKSWMQEATVSMPPDPQVDHCPCRTIYKERRTIFDCVVCKKSFHTACVGVNENDDVDEWCCVGCE